MSKQPLNIALVGKMRSGKDTVADILKREYGFGWFALSTGIRSVVSELGLDSESGPKKRHLYQGIGQHMRQYDEDVWCKNTWKNIELYNRIKPGYPQPYTGNIVVSDIRQKNEEKFFRERGFVIVKVVSSDDIRLERVREAGDEMTPEEFYHETELSVDTISADWFIRNEGTLEELEESICKLIDMLSESCPI